MQITGLTRKAIYYYERIGLVSPTYNEQNGYREYTNQHVELLHKINWMRTIGVGFSEIAEVFDKSKSVNEVIERRISAIDEEISALSELRDSLNAIYKTDYDFMHMAADWEKTYGPEDRTAATELSRVFPGPLGVLITIVFGPYLQTDVSSPIEKDALETLINSIDDATPFEVPPQLEAIFSEQKVDYGDAHLPSLSLEQMSNVDLLPDEAAEVSDSSEILASAIEPYVKPFFTFFSKTSSQFTVDKEKLLGIAKKYVRSNRSD